MISTMRAVSSIPTDQCILTSSYNPEILFSELQLLAARVVEILLKEMSRSRERAKGFIHCTSVELNRTAVSDDATCYSQGVIESIAPETSQCIESMVL